jgi:hypothetical protein
VDVGLGLPDEDVGIGIVLARQRPAGAEADPVRLGEVDDAVDPGVEGRVVGRAVEEGLDAAAQR